MHCVDCGYSMTAFDKECPRCERLRARRKGCPHCGTAAPLEAAQCPKCGHTYRTSFASEAAARRDEIVESGELTENLAAVPASPRKPTSHQKTTFAQPPPVSSPSAQPPANSAKTSASPMTTPLTAEMLACRVCGSTAAQKVSAVCQAGTWSGASKSSSVGAIYTGDGMIPITSVSATSSAGGTVIAQRLMPPPQPSFRHRWTLSTLVPITGYLIALCLCGQGFLTVSITIALTSVLWFFALLTEARSEAAGQAKLQTDHARWQEGMQVWDRLFYCSRCDHVYDPQGGGSAPPAGMYPLLFSHLPAVTFLPARELPLRLPPEKSAAIVGGCAIVGLGLLWGVTSSIARTAQENAAQENATQSTAVNGDATTDQPASQNSTSPQQTPEPSQSEPSQPGPIPPPLPAGSSEYPSPPPAFTMKTKAGGGTPPDVSQFSH